MPPSQKDHIYIVDWLAFPSPPPPPTRNTETTSPKTLESPKRGKGQSANLAKDMASYVAFTTPHLLQFCQFPACHLCGDQCPGSFWAYKVGQDPSDSKALATPPATSMNQWHDWPSNLTTYHTSGILKGGVMACSKI